MLLPKLIRHFELHIKKCAPSFSSLRCSFSVGLQFLFLSILFLALNHHCFHFPDVHQFSSLFRISAHSEWFLHVNCYCLLLLWKSLVICSTFWFERLWYLNECDVKQVANSLSTYGWWNDFGHVSVSIF